MTPRWQPPAYAFAAALISGYVLLSSPGGPKLGATDFDQVWYAARALLQHQDPYRAVLEGGAANGFPYYYPGTATLLGIPFALLDLSAARFAFVTLSGAALGWAIGRQRPHLWPILFSLQFFLVAQLAQWATLLSAALLVTGLEAFLCAKPNLGAVILAGSASWTKVRWIVGTSAIVVVLSLLPDPDWPWRWQDALRHSEHLRPFAIRPLGFVMLLGLLRWRDPDARLLVGLSLVPVTGMFYDALPAMLVARSRLQATALSLIAWVAWFSGPLWHTDIGFTRTSWVSGMQVLWGGMVPALALVLWRGRRSAPSLGVALDSTTKGPVEPSNPPHS
jgi:hypothetical protein